MHKPALIIGLVGALALPAVAQATGTPTAADRRSASEECRFERGSTAATREAFSAKYGTNKNKNAFGKCVSSTAKAKAEKREDSAETNAATAECKKQQAADAAKFAQDYKNLGQCVKSHKGGDDSD